MTWREADELELLLNALVDESLTAEQEAALAALLRDNAEARNRYRNWMTLHSALMWDYAEAASTNEPPSRITGIPSPWISKWAIAAAVALAAALPALFLARRPANPRAIATLEAIQGTIAWSGGGGAAPVQLAEGARLNGGTLYAEGEAASAQVRFLDGTLVSLAGDSEMALSDQGQKKLDLRKGTLTARVQHQPDGFPLLVHTSTAEIEVVGTEFSLSIGSNETAIDVAAGQVRLRRLVDGKIVAVSAGQSVVASLAVTELKPAATGMAPENWSIAFEAPPPSASFGRWLPPSSLLPGRLHAMPYVAGRKGGNIPVIHYSVGLSAGPGEPRGFATLRPDSILRFRYRLATDIGLKCFLSCRRARGAFGGNFETVVPESHSGQGSNEWRTVEVPFKSAHALMEESHPSPVGAQVALLLIHTYETDASLEIAEAAIFPASNRP